MEVFNFMPYTYYTRMTVWAGRKARNEGSFLRNGAGRSPEEHRIFNKKLTPLSSVAYGAPPSWGRGLLHYVMQQ